MSRSKTADYNYGFDIGSRFRFLFKILSNLDIGDKIFSEAKEHTLVLRDYYPQRLERLKGLACYLGTEPLKLQALSIHLAKTIKGGCTATFSAPPATRDGEVYLSWNTDIVGAARITCYLPFYIADIPGCNKYVSFGIPCVISFGLLNEFGLSSIPTAVGMKDGGGEGLMDYELNNVCMENCRDVPQVVEVYKNTKLYSLPALGAGMLLNLNCIWGDAAGRGVAIEHSSNHIHYQYAEDGILAITNHHQFLDRTLTGSPTPYELPAISGSYCRLGRAWNLLRKNRGNIDFEVVKRIMSDHYLEVEHIKDYLYEEPIDDGTICVHYWNILSYLRERRFKRAMEAYLMGKTIASLIIQPKRFIIWRCRGNPCNVPYKPIYFEDILHGHSTRNVSFSIAMNTKLARSFWRLPGIKRFMNKIFRPILKKWSILFFTALEKLVPVETKTYK
ncbi:MAG TPA: hypothetical protein EYP21_04860 [Syntrophaceae bacterium]|nr:hypothetical protein [Syntrophaceae bacterium]